MFSALGLAEEFYKAKKPSVVQYPGSNEKLDSTCVLIIQRYEKDKLSSVEVSSCRQFRSRDLFKYFTSHVYSLVFFKLQSPSDKSHFVRRAAFFPLRK